MKGKTMHSRGATWLMLAVASLLVTTIGLGGLLVPKQPIIQAKQVPTQQVPVNQTATALVRATEAAQAPPSAPAPTAASAESTTNAPVLRGFSEELLQQLRLPEGFAISVFAQAKGNVRMLAFGPDGTLYVTRREQGDLLALKDTTGDGRADSERIVASNLPYLNGVTVHQGRIYLATDKKVLRANLNADGSLGKLQTLIDDLPDAGQHPNRTLAVGPDNKLYITVGSTCNACNEPNKESATILIANLDGSGRHVYAKGLRNTIGFDWHPDNALLWGFDHGSDSRGDNQPPEELNLLQAG